MKSADTAGAGSTSATARGKLGRRIVVQFMLVASVPLLLLGALAHGAFVAQAKAQAQRQLELEVNAAAMQVLDRLTAARAALQVVADAQLSGTSDRRVLKEIFRTVTTVGHAPAVAAGADQLALQAWWRNAGQTPNASLHWQGRGSGALARVVLSVPDPVHAVTWLGDIDPAFLWANPIDAAGGTRLCVFDATNTPINCPAPDRPVAASNPRVADPTLLATKQLFLAHEFGAGDWRFRAQRPVSAPSAAELPFVGLTAQVVGAALLLVAVLSLIQVRRSIDPLQRLVDGTRRLARQDYGVRVQLVGDDEFRELGESFNEMATQMEEHVHEMALLSAIDREILDAPDVGRLVQRVLHRLGELAPTAAVAVCIVDPAQPLRLLCHVRRANGDVEVRELTPDASGWDAIAGDADTAAWVDTPPWFAGLIGRADGAVYCAPVTFQNRTQAVLLVAAHDDRTDTPQWRRRIDELRHRVAVALSAVAHHRLLVHQASHDSLTGLLNRSGLHEALDRLLGAGQPFAILITDLDRFKSVNDTLGHALGDEVLCLAAERLKAVLPDRAILTRPGGDEFVVALGDIAAPEQVQGVAQSICRTLADAFALAPRDVVLGASVGWARFPDDGSNAQELMRHADLAMYEAKDQGRGRAVRYTPPMDFAATQHGWLVSDLRLAVARHQLVLHYQPRVGALGQTARAAEALVRWQHPTHGLLAPTLFIEAAEEIGVIDELGRWVLHEACRQVRRWRLDGVEIDRISVNLSAHQLRSPSLFDDVVRALSDHGLAPTDLELEVTESVWIHDQRAASELLGRFRQIGITIALDDFGTGYSSMAYLSSMPVDVIKVDRAFVKNLGCDPSADTVTRAIVALAHSLHLRLVAEGVETPAQADTLTQLGCQELQGYLYARPVPADEYARLDCVRAGARRFDEEHRCIAVDAA